MYFTDFCAQQYLTVYKLKIILIDHKLCWLHISANLTFNSQAQDRFDSEKTNMNVLYVKGNVNLHCVLCNEDVDLVPNG